MKPDRAALEELMKEMMAMDAERLNKKRRGPSITIAIGVPKGEGHMDANDPGESKEPMAMEQGKPEMEEMMGMGDMMKEKTEPMTGPEEMSEESDLAFDSSEKALIEQARSMGIPDPESMDMRLLKKMVDKKRGTF